MLNDELDLREVFLSSTGRLSRTPFLIASAIIIAVVALYESIVGTALHWLTGWFFYPAVLFCGACVLSKRLHDRGRSGWWSALILLAVLVVWPHPAGFFDFLFSLVLLWAAVELGMMRGEQGANRYGSNPVGPTSTPI